MSNKNKQLVTTNENGNFTTTLIISSAMGEGLKDSSSIHKDINDTLVKQVLNSYETIADVTSCNTGRLPCVTEGNKDKLLKYVCISALN